MVPWKGRSEVPISEGGWQTIAPSAIPFNDVYPKPRAMTIDDIEAVVGQFVAATQRSLDAGFRVVELHMAHGYLLHQFLSPLSNHRTDDFGGSLEIRCVCRSASQGRCAKLGPPTVPFLCASPPPTGPRAAGTSRNRSASLGAARVGRRSDRLLQWRAGRQRQNPSLPGLPGPLRRCHSPQSRACLPVPSGLITEPKQADDIIFSGKADAVFLARAMLRDPYWPLHAAKRWAPKAAGRSSTNARSERRRRALS